MAEVLVGSAEFERRVAAGASTESIAEAARAAGCATLWESGLDLVRRGETTLDELRRVAAEPVRVVTEPTPTGVPQRVRIGWCFGNASPAVDRVRSEIVAASRSIGGHVHIVEHRADAAPGTLPFDALIVDAAPSARGAKPGDNPLVVALAHDASASDHVHALARDADLVMSDSVHGRILLATVLALLRWRSR